jgi:hypothetical protein
MRPVPRRASPRTSRLAGPRVTRPARDRALVLMRPAVLWLAHRRCGQSEADGSVARWPGEMGIPAIPPTELHPLGVRDMSYHGHSFDSFCPGLRGEAISLIIRRPCCFPSESPRYVECVWVRRALSDPFRWCPARTDHHFGVIGYEVELGIAQNAVGMSGKASVRRRPHPA